MKASAKTHDGRIALVTGAGQGIGQAIALALADRGAQVIATDLKPPHETARKIGPTAYALELDVTKEEDWHALSLEGQNLGGVDIVVNNAGYPKPLYRRTGSADVAKSVCYELRLTLFKREIFLAIDEEEEVGPLRRHIVKYGGFGYTRHEPLHRYKDGHHRVHEGFGQRYCKRRNYRELRIARSNAYTSNRGPIRRTKTRHLGTAGDRTAGRTRRCHGRSAVLDKRRCGIYHRAGNCR
jgi:short subunit dehydrogenase